MNGLARGLLSGASLAALSLGGVTAAQAAHIAVSSTVAAVTVTHAQAFDFIEVLSTGRVIGSITNDGVVELPGQSFGISVDGGASVGGSIVNAGRISAQSRGIVVQATGAIGGAILNAGQITVAPGPAASDVIAIDARGPVAGGVTNSGHLNVNATGTNTNARIAGVRESGSPTQALANSGTLIIDARGIGKFFAVSQQALGGVAATASLTNARGAAIHLDAEARGSSAKIAIAVGITQGASAPSGAAAVSLTNDGVIAFDAAAFSTIPAGPNASAVVAQGIRQRAIGSNVPVAPGGLDASVTLTNSGLIRIDAIAGGAVRGTAEQAIAQVGTGIYQLASGTDPGRVGNVAAALTNSGTIAIGATALGSGHTGRAFAAVTRDAVFQDIVFGRSASASLTNSGMLKIQAVAYARASHTASALASIRATQLINQFLSATNLAASVAQGNLTNSGVLTVLATARATGAKASAFAVLNDLEGAIRQFAGDADTDTVTLTNSGTLSITAFARASAAGGPASARAFDTLAIGQSATAANNKVLASASLSNTGTLSIDMIAIANAPIVANARADADHAIRQHASNALADSVSLVNAGTLALLAQASALNAVKVRAIATSGATGGAVSQKAIASGTVGSSASATLTNSGTLAVDMLALGRGGAATAVAKVPAFGLKQSAQSADAASATLTNSASLAFTAGASATGSAGKAIATALLRHAVFQSAGADAAGKASAALTNSGTMTLAANAHAKAHAATAKARATIASGLIGVAQHGLAETVGLTNSGTIKIAAGASATGAPKVTAHALVGNGLYQHAVGPAPNVSVTNSGSFNVTVGVDAVHGVREKAAGFGRAILQSASATGAQVSSPIETITNSGTVAVAVHALAAPAKTASAVAGATGLFQAVHAGTAVAANAGKLTVSAAATATGSAKAVATARGIGVRFDGAVAAMGANLTNTGAITVTAAGKLSGPAAGGSTSAVGILLANHMAGGSLSGTIENDGTLTVNANGRHPVAKAVVINADQFGGAVVNRGTIAAAASAPQGALATGVLILPANAASGVGLGTVTNDGGTLLAESVANGVPSRANAINVSGAGNPVTVNLEGSARDGHIYGNIIDATGDAIAVSNGKTAFDGVINGPAAMVGSLGIAAGGTLELVRNIREGSASAYVNSYTQSGTLEIDVDATPQSAGSIHTNQATLGGTLAINPAVPPQPGSVTYRVIFSATPISGTWAKVGTADNSAVLETTAIYSPNEADVTLTRIAFHAVAGLTPNQFAVANALDQANAAGVGGATASLIADLVTLPIAPLTGALNALADEEDGELQQSDVEGAQLLVDVINDRLTAIAANGRASAFDLGAILPAQLDDVHGQIWGGGFGSWDRANATISGPRFSGNQGGVVMGFDTAIDNNMTVGAALAYAHGAVAINSGLSHGDDRGIQLALYGRYDDADEPWYAMASTVYGSYTNKSQRTVAITGFGTGIARARFHSNLWSLYGEGGYRFATGIGFEVAPYLALEFLDGESNAFTETGGPIPLAVSGTSARTFSSYLGASLSTEEPLAGTPFVPMLRASWQHEFEANPWILNAAIAGVPITGFRATGGALSKDHADISAGLSAKLRDDIEAMLNYEGRFSADRTDGAIVGRALVRF